MAKDKYVRFDWAAKRMLQGKANFCVLEGLITVLLNEEMDVIEMKTPEQVFPEYYLIRVNEFNKVATTPLEEWLDYLRSGHIKDATTAPGTDFYNNSMKMS